MAPQSSEIVVARLNPLIVVIKQFDGVFGLQTHAFLPRR